MSPRKRKAMARYYNTVQRVSQTAPYIDVLFSSLCPPPPKPELSLWERGHRFCNPPGRPTERTLPPDEPGVAVYPPPTPRCRP